MEVDTEGVALDAPAVTALTDPLGDSVARTADGRLVAWSLANTPSGTPADRARLLNPVLVGMTSGTVVVDGADVHQDSGPASAFSIGNLSSTEPVPVRVSVDVTSLGGPTREVVIRDGDQVLARATVGESAPSRMSFEAIARPGYERLTVAISGDPVRDSRDHSVSARFADLTATSPSAARVVSTHDQARTGVVIP